MSLEQYWIQIAQQKARTDAQDSLESFLKGVTNHYSQHVDVYMYKAYQDERVQILIELRESKNG